ncbi:RidA family protein [Sodalis sp. RH21]|uniref:RidA family protein n=1 Tax=unclassified Sodalis (in: enterobacteria) TaxID=2636512 RepID=UPI0039B4B7F4
MMSIPAYHSPPAMFKPTGPWNMLADTGSLVFLAGMRGILPQTNQLVADERQRIHQVFINIEAAAASVGLDMRHVVRLTVFVTDMKRYRPMVNEVQQERWANNPFPPRTIVEVSALNQDDFVEVEAILARMTHAECP